MTKEYQFIGRVAIILFCMTAIAGIGSLLQLKVMHSNIAYAATEPETIISPLNPVRTSPNSTAGIENGAILGNGDLLVSTAGNPEAMQFFLSKNDFFSDNANGFVRNPIMAGSIKVNIPSFVGATYNQVQDIYRAEIRSTFTKNGSTITMTSRTSATADNLLVTELSNSGSASVAVSVDTLTNHSDVAAATPTSAGIDGDVAWVTRQGPAGTSFVMRAAIATRIIGTAYTNSTDNDFRSTSSFTLPANATVTIVSQIKSTGAQVPLTTTPGDPLPSAISGVSALTSSTVAGYTNDHLLWWSNYWSKSYIDIANANLKKYYYGALYILASSNRTGKYPAGLNGWNNSDHPDWNGDYHLNYNFQAPYYGVYSSNRPELADSYYKVINEYDATGKQLAIANGFKGTYFKVGAGPAGMTTDDNFWGQKTNAIESAMNYINHYYYTYDTSWLSTTGYPFLKDVADFWDDYLYKDANGRYAVTESGVAETLNSFNPTTALSFIKYFYKGLIDASVSLGVDADRRSKWQDIVDHISPFNLTTYNGKSVFAYTAENDFYVGNYPYNLYPLVPTNLVGLETPYNQIAKDSVLEMNAWDNGNAFPNIFTAAARAGVSASTIISNMDSRIAANMKTNLFVKQWGGGLETVGGIDAINSMLLQGHEGIIRLFPVWNGTDAKFANLRTYGAFVVSSRMQNGIVQELRITSDKGNVAKVLNPWAGQNLIVTAIGGGVIPTAKVGENYSFQTSAGTTYTLTPQGGIPAVVPTPPTYPIVPPPAMPTPTSGPNIVEWNFDTAGYKEGWRASGDVSGLDAASGSLHGTIVGSDPYVFSGMNINAAITTNKVLKIGIKQSTNVTSAKVFFTTANDAAFSESKSKTFNIAANGTDFVEYTVDMSSVSEWNGLLNQLRIDPEDGAGSGTFSIDYVKLVNSAYGNPTTPTPTNGISWEFNTAGNLEGWTGWANNNVSGLNVTGGLISGTITGIDPIIKSGDNLGVNIATNTIIRIGLKQSTSSTTGTIYFTTTADTGWDAAKSKTFAIAPNGSTISEYVIDMSTVGGWTGTLNALRIDPEEGVGSGTFAIDYIRVETPLAQSWEFNTVGDLEGWTGWANNNVSGLNVTGGLISGTITGIDPIIKSGDNLGVNIATNKIIRIGLKQSTSSTTGTIYFTTTADTGWNAAKSKTFTVASNGSTISEYVIDMSTVGGWTGTLNALRIDPEEGAGSGTFAIDYIRISYN